MRSSTAGSCPPRAATTCTGTPASKRHVSWLPRNWCSHKLLKPSLEALRRNSFVVLRGLRGADSEKTAPFAGGFGKHQSVVGQLDQREVDPCPIRHAG